MRRLITSAVTLQTLAAEGENCTVGGSDSQIGVTWFADADHTLRIRMTTDGVRWDKEFVLASANPLVPGTTSTGNPFLSTTTLVLSEPYGLLIPGPNGLKAVWQAGGVASQVLVGNAVAKSVGKVFVDPGNVTVPPTAATFLPGAGRCGRIAGAHQVTTSAGQFRYKVWPLTGAGPVEPLFVSRTDLDRKNADNDPRLPGFPRIGDYTSTDCSGQIGWAVWTDLHDGGPSTVRGALIPLDP